MDEQFSAFLDGEATRGEADSVINALLRDETLAASWSRQHWLRTTLRAHGGEISVALDPGFSTRVMRAIDEEDRAEGAGAPAPVTPARYARRSRRRWRGVAGLAAVASVTGIVLLVSNPMRPDARSGASVARSTPATRAQTGTKSPAAAAASPTLAARTGGSPSIGSLAADSRVASAARAQPVAAQDAARVSRPRNRWSVSDPALADELNGYLVDHNGLARGYGLSGTTPALVRVATYGQVAPQ